MLIPQGSYTFTDFHDEDVRIGKYTAIARECVFHGADNHKTNVANNLSHDRFSKGQIVIGNDVWIGAGVCFLSGVKVGDGAIVGAHAVITKDVPPYALVAGNPAQVKKYRFLKKEIKKLLEIKWWDWEHETIEKRLADFEDVNIFLKRYS